MSEVPTSTTQYEYHKSIQKELELAKARIKELEAELDEARKEIIRLELIEHHPFQHDFIKDEKACETCKRIKKLQSRHAQQGGKGEL